MRYFLSMVGAVSFLMAVACSFSNEPENADPATTTSAVERKEASEGVSAGSSDIQPANIPQVGREPGDTSPDTSPPPSPDTDTPTDSDSDAQTEVEILQSDRKFITIALSRYRSSVSDIDPSALHPWCTHPDAESVTVPPKERKSPPVPAYLARRRLLRQRTPSRREARWERIHQQRRSRRSHAHQCDVRHMPDYQ